jgi:hypothetical protein
MTICCGRIEHSYQTMSEPNVTSKVIKVFLRKLAVITPGYSAGGNCWKNVKAVDESHNCNNADLLENT